MCEFFCTGNNTGSDLFSKGRKILYKDIAFGKEILFSGRRKKLPDVAFQDHSVKKRKRAIDFILILF